MLGATIYHQEFGLGVVIAIDEDIALVDFLHSRRHSRVNIDTIQELDLPFAIRFKGNRCLYTEAELNYIFSNPVKYRKLIEDWEGMSPYEELHPPVAEEVLEQLKQINSEAFQSKCMVAISRNS